MILSALIGILGGLLIGRRFKVFATVPVLLVALVAAATSVATGDASFGRATLAFLLFSISLQAGYLASTVLSAPSRRPAHRASFTT